MCVCVPTQGFAAMNKLKKEALKIIVGFLPETEIMGLRQMFKSIDADGSGTITVAELRHALKAKGTLIPEADITRLVCVCVCHSVWPLVFVRSQDKHAAFQPTPYALSPCRTLAHTNRLLALT